MYNFSPCFDFKSVAPTATNLLICPDQYIANYAYSGGKWQLTPLDPSVSIEYDYDQNGNEKCRSRKRNTIAIILESPHKDEYKYINGVLVPIGPLTGKREVFTNNFDTAIQKSKIFKHLRPNTYNIALINAVQYQCSQGKALWSNKTNQAEKNNNVINSWHSGIKKDFMSRLKALRPCIIINLSGETFPIFSLVEQEIKNESSFAKHIANGMYTTGTHPSSWQKKLNNSPSAVLIN